MKTFKNCSEWKVPEPEAYAKALIEKECFDAFQSLEYEVNTLHTSNGQTPFVTFGFGLGTTWQSKLIQRSILKNRIRGLGKITKPQSSQNWCLPLKKALTIALVILTTTLNNWL